MAAGFCRWMGLIPFLLVSCLQGAWAIPQHVPPTIMNSTKRALSQPCHTISNHLLKAVCLDHSQNLRVTRFCTDTLAQHKYITTKREQEFRRCFQLNFIATQMPRVLERLGLCRKYVKEGIGAVIDCAMLLPDNYALGLSCIQTFSRIDDLRFCYSSPKPAPVIFECLRLSLGEERAHHCLSRVTDLTLLHACQKLYFNPSLRNQCLDWQLNSSLSSSEALTILRVCLDQTDLVHSYELESARKDCVERKQQAFLALKARGENTDALLDDLISNTNPQFQ